MHGCSTENTDEHLVPWSIACEKASGKARHFSVEKGSSCLGLDLQHLENAASTTPDWLLRGHGEGGARSVPTSFLGPSSPAP